VSSSFIFAFRFASDDELSRAAHLCIDVEAKEIFVCDNAGNRVSVFTTSGKFRRHLGTKGRHEDGALVFPAGIVLHPTREEMIVSGHSHDVLWLNRKTGAFVRKVGCQGTGAPGRFLVPNGICVVHNQRQKTTTLYVADAFNRCVHMFFDA